MQASLDYQIPNGNKFSHADTESQYHTEREYNLLQRSQPNSLSGTLDGRFTTLASSYREFSSPSCWQCPNIGSRDISRQIGWVMTMSTTCSAFGLR